MEQSPLLRITVKQIGEKQQDMQVVGGLTGVNVQAWGAREGWRWMLVSGIWRVESDPVWKKNKEESPWWDDRANKVERTLTLFGRNSKLNESITTKASLAPSGSLYTVLQYYTLQELSKWISVHSVLKATRIHSWCLKTRQSPFWKMLIPSSHAQISHCRFKLLSYSISRKQDTDLVCKRCTSWVYQFLSCAQRQKHRKPDMEGMDNMHYIL